MADRLQLTRDLFDAYTEKDRAKIEAIIAPTFSFTSPLDNQIDRESYFERCWPNSEESGAFDYIHMVEDGDRVFVTYEADSNGQRFRNTEIMTFAGDQVVAVEVYFGWTLPHEAPKGGFIEDDEE